LIPISLRDVARAAGVSVASASRALNAPELVSQGLKARILAAADRLGYVPNLAARSLATRRSGLVGVLVESLADPLIAGLVEALDWELHRAGYRVALAFAGQNAAETSVRIRGLLAQGLDGLLVLDEAVLSPEDTMAFRARGMPWLVLDDAKRDHGGDAMGRVVGAALAGRYLLSLGHQRIGLLAVERGAVEAALREALAGTAAVALPVKPAGNRSRDDSLREALAELVNRPDPATAIICDSDSQAMAALRECHASGLSVPRQISIVGFGDTELAKHTWPSLTTVRVSMNDSGARAAEALLAALGGKAAQVKEPIVKLVVRESTTMPQG
jgi:LacI family transcriptional regulator